MEPQRQRIGRFARTNRTDQRVGVVDGDSAVSRERRAHRMPPCHSPAAEDGLAVKALVCEDAHVQELMHVVKRATMKTEGYERRETDAALGTLILPLGLELIRLVARRRRGFCEVRRSDFAANYLAPQLRQADAHEVRGAVEERPERDAPALSAETVHGLAPLVNLGESLQVVLELRRPGMRLRLQGAVRHEGEVIVAAQVAEHRAQPHTHIRAHTCMGAARDAW